MSSSSLLATTEKVQRIPLATADFEKAIAQFIDETKPDSLVKRQLQGWKLEWSNDDSTTNKSKTASKLEFAPTHVVMGSLQIEGEFLQVTLHTACWWCKAQEDNGEGRLVYECRASAQFVSNDSDDEKQKKRLKKVKKRLEKDDYLRKLLLDSKQNVVCVARIYQSPPNELEERVDCHEEIGEALRRAVFSAADSALDVFEVLLQLPCLPTSHHALAKRAKMRLLEDAMCNACEQQGEDELVSDLELKEPQAKKSRK